MKANFKIVIEAEGGDYALDFESPSGNVLAEMPVVELYSLLHMIGVAQGKVIEELEKKLGRDE